MDPLHLDNILWRALSGSQSHLAAGTHRIRRFAPGYSPLIGYADVAAPDFAALAPFCRPGERFYCAYWRGDAPEGWRVELDTSMCAMIWRGQAPEPDPGLEAVRLDRAHISDMMALAELRRPGPFAERTFEMGEFHGVIEGGRLVAMAGERMHAAPLREVSGVCVQPDHEGRGLARRLTALVVRRQLGRGETPFLHVASANARARALYERMGFAVEREVALRIVTFTGAASEESRDAHPERDEDHHAQGENAHAVDDVVVR